MYACKACTGRSTCTGVLVKMESVSPVCFACVCNNLSVQHFVGCHVCLVFRREEVDLLCLEMGVWEALCELIWYALVLEINRRHITFVMLSAYGGPHLRVSPAAKHDCLRVTFSRSQVLFL